MAGGAGKPLVRIGWQVVIGPVTILASWRADDASHVARCGQHKFDRTQVQTCSRESRFPGRDMVLARRQDEGRDLDLGQVDWRAGESDASGLGQKILSASCSG
jgi:hypothetical protein